MTTQYTPGPWVVSVDFHDDEESLDYMRVVADGAAVAEKILEDDARLIAAAPDLLKATQLLINAVTSLDVNKHIEAREFARAVIAKATGE